MHWYLVYSGFALHTRNGISNVVITQETNP
jgi:hypothetical protein